MKFPVSFAFLIVLLLNSPWKIASAPNSYARAGICVSCGQAGAEAQATVDGFDNGNENGRSFGHGPSAGAGVQIGANSGVGFNLGLGEVGVDSKYAGEKVGFNLDTGVNAGTGGFTAKVAGTGTSITSRGVEVCFFGSCVRVG